MPEIGDTIDMRPLGRAAQRLFSATQWLFVLAIAFAVVMGAAVATGEIAEYEGGVANNVFRALLFGSLFAYAVLFAMMSYRPRYWRGAMVASLLMILALLFISVAAVALPDPETGLPEEDPWGLLFGVVVVMTIPLLWFLRQILGARRLLAAPFRGERGGVKEAMTRAEAAFAAQRRAGHGARARFGWLGGGLKTLSLAAIAAVVAAVFATLALPEDEDGLASEVLSSVIGLGVFTLPLFAFLLGLGRRLSQPDAERLLEADERAPVLLLRSFQDDQATLPGVNAFKRLLYLGLYGKVRLEEAIADELGRLGPFIAVGQPGERLPTLGAARAYLSDGEWREKVLDWMTRGRMTVLIAGATKWVGWELSQVAAQGRLDRLLLLLPPARGAEDRGARWAVVREALAKTRWEDRVASEDLNDAIAFFEDRDGRLVAVKCARPRQTDYELAVRLAVSEKFGPEAVA